MRVVYKIKRGHTHTHTKKKKINTEYSIVLVHFLDEKEAFKYN